MCGGEEEYLSCRGMLTFELRPGRGVGPFELGLPVCVCVCVSLLSFSMRRDGKCEMMCVLLTVSSRVCVVPSHARMCVCVVASCRYARRLRLYSNMKIRCDRWKSSTRIRLRVPELKRHRLLENLTLSSISRPMASISSSSRKHNSSEWWRCTT